MKFSQTAALIVAAIVAILPTITQAEPPKIERVIELLHEAKNSDKPLPLLEQAHKILKDFNPTNGTKMTASGIGAKRSANLELAAHEKKHKAMEAIAEAIETAKNGGDAKSKIESAVAHAHQAGELKN